MHNVKFRYPDNVFHEPHFMCGIVGPMSLGKGSITPVIETIIRTLREHDVSSNAKLNEWKRQCKTAGANKQKPTRPEDAARVVELILEGLTREQIAHQMREPINVIYDLRDHAVKNLKKMLSSVRNF